jgi:hypothetical protein
LDDSFVELVVECLNSFGSEDQKRNFAISLASQLDTICQHSPAQLADSKTNSESLSSSSLQQSLFMRATILVPLLPIVKKYKKQCKWEELCRSILLLLSKPTVLAEEELFAYLLTILDTLLNETNQEEQTKQKEIYQKLQVQFQEIDFPATHRLRIEQALPLFNSNSRDILANVNIPGVSAKNKRNIEIWSSLEDYPDAPLSPSLLGGERVERKDLTYVTDMFQPKKKVKL